MYSGGNGTIDNPYLIKTEIDLHNVRFNMDKHFKQIKSITCKSDSFEPLCIIDGDTNYDGFTGSYDGGHYFINRLKIDGYYDGCTSLFGIINGHVHHLHINKAKITSDATDYGDAAILATMIFGHVTDCSVSGEISGYRVGGFCATAGEEAKIERCCANTQIQAVYAAGFCTSVVEIDPWEEIYPTAIIDCYAHGSIARYPYDDSGELSGFVGSGWGCLRCFTTVKIYNTPAYEPENYLWHDGLFGYINSDVDKYKHLPECYVDVENGGQQEPWHDLYGYIDYSSYVRGADGELYTCIESQNYYDDNGNLGNPGAKPPNSDYWELSYTADPTVARNTAFFKDKDNFPGWDFENVWQIKKNDKYPSFIRKSKAQLEAMPLTSITVVS